MSKKQALKHFEDKVIEAIAADDEKPKTEQVNKQQETEQQVTKDE